MQGATTQHIPMAVLNDLWETLRNTPVSSCPAGVCIDLDWLTFRKGTPVETIWHWFETQNPRFIVADVQQNKRVDDDGNPVPQANSLALVKYQFRALIDRGLTFGDCVEAFGETADENRYLAAAYLKYRRDGELEFDDKAVVSVSDDAGAYVMCWRWVDNEDAGIGEHGLSSGDLVYWFCPDDDSKSGTYSVKNPFDKDAIVILNAARNKTFRVPLEELVRIEREEIAEWVGLHHKVNFDAEPVDRQNEWIRRYAESQTVECSECGKRISSVLGCPDGAEICQSCFDNGTH